MFLFLFLDSEHARRYLHAEKLLDTIKSSAYAGSARKAAAMQRHRGGKASKKTKQGKK